jgi:hypothetical protein
MNEIVKRENGVFVVPADMPAEAVKARFPKATEADTAKAVAMLFTGLKAADRGDMNAEMTAEIYGLVLAEYPTFAIEAAVLAFLRGQVEGASNTFVPSTAELVNEIERQFWLRIRHERRSEPDMVPVLPDDHFTKRWARGEVEPVTTTADAAKLIAGSIRRMEGDHAG